MASKHTAKATVYLKLEVVVTQSSTPYCELGCESNASWFFKKFTTKCLTIWFSPSTLDWSMFPLACYLARNPSGIFSRLKLAWDCDCVARAEFQVAASSVVIRHLPLSAWISVWLVPSSPRLQTERLYWVRVFSCICCATAICFVPDGPCGWNMNRMWHSHNAVLHFASLLHSAFKKARCQAYMVKLPRCHVQMPSTGLDVFLAPPCAML